MVSRLKNSFILEDLQSVPAGYDFYPFLSTFSYCKHFISIGWIIVPVNITTARLSREAGLVEDQSLQGYPKVSTAESGILEGSQGSWLAAQKKVNIARKGPETLV